MPKAIRRGNRSPFQRFFSDPFTAIFVFLIYSFFRILPYKIASSIGAKIGVLLYFLMKKRNIIARRNLEIAFPKKTDDQREEILKKMWQHWGRYFAEMPHGETLYRLARKTGLENLQNISLQNKGCFVCSAHLGNWEPAVSAPLFENYYLNPVYRVANNPWIDKIMFQRRKGVLIPKGSAGAKKMISVLHNNGAVVILCDQKLKEGIDVPFFGKLVKTAPAIASMALKMNLPIVMAKCIRAEDGIFDITVSKPLQLPDPTKYSTDECVYMVMKNINETIQAWIEENPEQWLWVHHRFDKQEYKR